LTKIIYYDIIKSLIGGDKMTRYFDKLTGEYIDGRKAKFEDRNTILRVTNELFNTNADIFIHCKNNRKMSDKIFRKVKNYKEYPHQKIEQGYKP